MRVAVDLGVSNLDAVAETGGEHHHWAVPSGGLEPLPALRRALEAADVPPATIRALAVTGGRSRLLPDAVDGLALVRVPEIEAVARGGLALSSLPAALVVSAGSGTALAGARAEGPGETPRRLQAQHVGGTGVGGGTLLGLGRLLLGTTDPAKIDALAAAGRARAVDLTIGDVVGGSLSHLSPEATAVNFGRLVHQAEPPAREDLAAALVTLVGQTIGLMMAKAAQAHGFNRVVVVGHLVDMPSLRRILGRFGPFFGGEVVIPEHAGTATALGALLALNDPSPASDRAPP